MGGILRSRHDPGRMRARLLHWAEAVESAAAVVLLCGHRYVDSTADCCACRAGRDDLQPKYSRDRRCCRLSALLSSAWVGVANENREARSHETDAETSLVVRICSTRGPDRDERGGLVAHVPRCKKRYIHDADGLLCRCSSTQKYRRAWPQSSCPSEPRGNGR